MTAAEEMLTKELGQNFLQGSLHDRGLRIAEVGVRHKYIRDFGFAVLTAATVDYLRGFGPLLEVGSGSGYWAYELRKAGIDIVATDPLPIGNGNPYSFKRIWLEPESLYSRDAVLKYPDRTLLMVWPCYDKRWAAEALAVYRGTTVLYVGEGKGGCTGDRLFHYLLRRRYVCREHVHIPQFIGIHDYLEVWDRKPWF